MRGHGTRGLIADNLNAVNPYLNAKQNMSTRFKLCWKCQKSKSPAGGHLKMYPGLCKFICKDCIEAKLKEKTT